MGILFSKECYCNLDESGGSDQPDFYDKKLYIPDNPYIYYNTSSSKSFSRYLDI